MSDLVPPRKALLYVVDSATGKTYPVKVVLQDDGTVLVPVSLEGNTVGVATEETLSRISAVISNMLLDEFGRVFVRDPNVDEPLSTARSKVNIHAIGGVLQSGEDWTPHIAYIDNLATEKTLSYMAVEDGKRCQTVTIDGPFAVPSGQTWYVRELYIESGFLYLDGDVKVV